MTARRTRRRGARRRAAAIAAGVALAGALTGGALAQRIGGRFVPPLPPDSQLWEVVIPGRTASVTAPHLGRGTQLRDGALWLGEYAFGRADRIRPQSEAPVSQVQVEIAHGEVQLLFTGSAGPGQPKPAIDLRPGAARLSAGGDWTALEPGPLTVALSGGRALALLPGGAVSLGQVGPGSVELHSLGGGAIRRIVLAGADGETLVDRDYSALGAGVPAWVGAALGAAAGALLGAALAWSGGPIAVAAAQLTLAPPALVLLVPYAGWVDRVEGLGLVKTSAWDLARMALLAAGIPLALLAALRAPAMAISSARSPSARSPSARWGSLAAVLVAGGLASREGPWWLAAGGLAFLALPWMLAERAKLPPLGWLVRDLPALAAVAALGWPLGLLPAALWRLVPVIASSGLLLHSAPRAASDHLFLLVCCLPFTAELALRGTYLDRAWQADAISGRDAAPWQAELAQGLTPFWSARCGPRDAARSLSLVFAGGSSTGGAYQFRGTPEAFYPALVHRALCAELPQGTALSTWNYGKGGRDTHIIARALPAVLEATGADAVVLYVGVNDILTANSTQTRRQREVATGGAAPALGGLARRSRLVTGAGLYLRWARISAAPPGALVSEVPLPDARENLAQIAQEAGEGGAALLLVSQELASDQARQLADYWAAERALAQNTAGVDFFDARAAFAGRDDGAMLLDENHLSRGGHRLLAEALLPSIRQSLALP